MFRRIPLALGAALLINLVLLTLAARLSNQPSRPRDMTAPVPVQLVQLPPPAELPVPEEVIAPRPQPVVTGDFTPDLVRPLFVSPAAVDVTIALDISNPVEFGLDGLFVFNGTDLDQAPRALVMTQPLYPYRAQQLEIEGWVTVRFLVGTGGEVSQVTVVSAQPEGLFEAAVLQMVPRWRFTPGMIAGRPVPSWVENTIRFEFS